MPFVIKSLSHGKDGNMPQESPLSTGQDDLKVKAGGSNPGMLNVIEWHHMNLALFYPAALGSTWTVRTCLYPLSVLRSRLQLQKQHTVYSSTWNAFTSIVKQEGIAGLFRGFWVTIPQVGTSFIYATVYEKLRAVLQHDYGIRSTAGISSISGGAASFSTQIIFVPTDIIAQYLMIYYKAEKFISGHDRAIINYVINDKSSRLTLGMKFIKAIYKVDGLRGFYRGFWASSCIYVPYCLVFWPSYYWTQDLCRWVRPPGTRDSGLLLMDQAISAFVGGICATLCTNPFEMFRIRVQVHRSSYKETLSRMIKDEKRHIFTKGLVPRLVSNSIYTCVVMVGYEIVKRLCVLPEYKDKVKW